jgi:hypothetical protein
MCAAFLAFVKAKKDDTDFKSGSKPPVIALENFFNAICKILIQAPLFNPELGIRPPAQSDHKPRGTQTATYPRDYTTPKPQGTKVTTSTGVTHSATYHKVPQ